jgi:hypothetical protein
MHSSISFLNNSRPVIKSVRPVANAIKRLNETRIVKAEISIKRLYEKLGRVRILGLYCDVFPNEFASSTASLEPDREAVERLKQHDLDYPPHSPREVEFFHLVDKHLFNLPLHMIEYYDERLDHIMFQSPFNGWNEDDPYHYRPVFQLAGAFASEGNWTIPELIIKQLTGEIDEDCHYLYLRDEYEVDPTLLLVAINHNQRNRFWSIYEKLVRSLDPPICYMVDAINVMSFDTGIFELDVNCLCGSCGQELGWARENVEMLARQHKEAKLLFDRLDKLEEWIEADPVENITEMVILYNYAAYLAGAIDLIPTPRETQLSLFYN